MINKILEIYNQILKLDSEERDLLETLLKLSIPQKTLFIDILNFSQKQNKRPTVYYYKGSLNFEWATLGVFLEIDRDGNCRANIYKKNNLTIKETNINKIYDYIINL